MKLTKFGAATLTAAALGLGTAYGVPTAAAAPIAPAPLKPGHGNDGCFPFCDGGLGRDGAPGRDIARGNGRANDGHWDDKGPWWANNRHDWWDDRRGAPPWGWGPPPPVYWNNGPLPPTINYWGYNLNPVWDNGFRQWGVWFFGVWVPIFGVGFR